MSNELHSALLIAAMSIGTILLRFLPFAVFGGKKHVPRFVTYLGDALPGAVLGMLVIYCLKDLNLTQPPYGFMELAACAVVVALQLWKKNSLISILVGTLVYMLLGNLI